MAPDPKAVLKLADDIVKAEEHLAKLKSAWEAMFTPASNPAPATRKREGSLASRVEAVVVAEPDRVFTIGYVAGMLEEDSLKVGRALFQLANNNRIISPSRGLYRAKPVEAVAA
jgi:hypothetical protein